MTMNSIQEQENWTTLEIISITTHYNHCGKQNSIPSDHVLIVSSRRHDGEGGRILFRKAITTRLLPLLRSFSPDLILVSSGFDGGFGDVGNQRFIPSLQVGMNLKVEDYAWALGKIVEVANMCCNGRIVSLLEGGYGAYERQKGSDDTVLAR